MVNGRRWAIAQLDDLQTDGRRALIRRHFGIDAFGVNAWRGARPGDLVIDDHDELVEGHEELYVVLRGRATFTVEGEQFEAREGTLVIVPPPCRRTAVAAEPETVVVAIGGERGHPFSASAWEEWGALEIPTLLEERRYAEAADRYESAVDRHPDHAGALYNLACLLSLAGRGDDALRHLARAVELHAPNAGYARADPDFASVRDDPRFAAIVGADP